MKVVDLSKPIRSRRTDPPFMRTTVRPKPRWLSRWLIRAAGLPFRLFPKDFEGWADDTITRMGVHATTHVDAPWHYGPTCGGEPAPTIDQIPLDRCFGPGVVFDMRHKPDFEPITVPDLEASLAASGAVLSERTIALIRTGRDRFIEEPDYWKRGTGMSAAATEWLLEHGIVLMGIDQWGWDVPLLEQVRRAKAENDREVFWAAHRVGQRRPFWHMEQLVNLGSLPLHGFTVAVFPLKLVGASAAPARVVAFVSSTAEDESFLDTARTSMGQA
jgi:kynurenine formamidase